MDLIWSRTKSDRGKGRQQSVIGITDAVAQLPGVGGSGTSRKVSDLLGFSPINSVVVRG
jgi:hypothetical protein